MNSSKIYNMSFTAGAAMLNETHAVATALLECGGDWERTRELTFRDNLMQKNKVSSYKRYFALMKQRIETLNAEELQMLVSGNMAARRVLVLLAICKAHPFVYDFIVENVRESFYNLEGKITQANFNEFYNEKKFEHPELEQVSELTVAKMRQVILRILEQTEIIESSKTGVLHRPYISGTLEKLVVKDSSKWLGIYLYSNEEIRNLSDLYV